MNIELLKKLLDRPIAFHRCFAAISGSTLAGLMLSQAFYWATRQTVIEKGGWFYKTQAEWYEETFMGRSEQELARKRLRERGFIQEEKRGIPAKIFYRVCFERILYTLTAEEQGAEEPPSQDAESCNLVCRPADSCNVG